MSEFEELARCWRTNYGLDKRTPQEAMRWWHDALNGKAPSGAVAALGLALQEVDRLTAELASWRKIAERRGDELKAIYIQQSKEDTCEKQS